MSGVVTLRHLLLYFRATLSSILYLAVLSISFPLKEPSKRGCKELNRGMSHSAALAEARHRDWQNNSETFSGHMFQPFF